MTPLFSLLLKLFLPALNLLTSMEEIIIYFEYLREVKKDKVIDMIRQHGQYDQLFGSTETISHAEYASESAGYETYLE